MFYINIWPNLAPLQDIRLQSQHDLDLGVSRSRKVRTDDAIGLPIYGFLQIASNMGPNSTPLWNIRL